MAIRKDRRIRAVFQARLGVSDYEAYKAQVVLLFKQQVSHTQPDPLIGAPNSYNVGYDNALMDAPTSCGSTIPLVPITCSERRGGPERF